MSCKGCGSGKLETATKPAWVHDCIRQYRRRGMSEQEAAQRCYGAANARKMVLGFRLPSDEKAVPEKYSHIDFKPTEAMANAARAGLEMRREHGRGGTAVGVARARDLMNRTTLSPETARRMYSFFSRHEVDKRGQGFEPGEEGYPSAGRIAWNLWGGDPGFSWARARVEQMDAADKREKAYTPTVTVFKGADGKRYLFIVASNGYEDRDGEYVTAKALASDVDAAWQDGAFRGYDLKYWHGGDPVGRVIWADMEGPFLIEVAQENDTPFATALFDYLESHPDEPWGASIGFQYIDKAKVENTYFAVHQFETSILPLEYAANPYTFAGVINMEARESELEKRGLGKLIDRARSLIKKGNAELEDAGLEHKAHKNRRAKQLTEEELRDVVVTALETQTEEITAADTPAAVEAVIEAAATAIVETVAEEAPQAVDEMAVPDEEKAEGEALTVEATAEQFSVALAEVLATKLETVPENLVAVVTEAVNEVLAMVAPQDVEGGDAMPPDALTEEMNKAIHEIIGGVEGMQTAQKALADENTALKAQLATLTAQLKALESTPAEIKTLAKRLTGLERIAARAPRLASKDKATVVVDEDMPEEMAKAVTNEDEYYENIPGIGRALKSGYVFNPATGKPMKVG